LKHDVGSGQASVILVMAQGHEWTKRMAVTRD